MESIACYGPIPNIYSPKFYMLTISDIRLIHGSQTETENYLQHTDVHIFTKQKSLLADKAYFILGHCI